MKKLKLFSLLLIFVIACSFVSQTKAESNIEKLIDALNSTLDANDLQVDSEATLSIGKNEFVLEDNLEKDGNKIKRTNHFDFHFEMDDLPTDLSEELIDEFYFLSEDLTVDLEADATLYLNTKNKDIFYEISDYDINIEAENQDIKNIVEGFFEITRIFTGETYFVNFDEVLEEFDEFQEIYDEINELNIQNANNQDWGILLEIFLKSGFFDVKIENNLFVITLKDEVDFFDTALIAEKVQELSFLPANEKEMILYDLDMEFKEDDYLEINSALDEMEKYFDFSIKVNLKGEYIRDVDVFFSFDIENLLKDSGENIEIDDFVFSQNIELDYSNISVTLPNQSSKQISLNKIIKLFLTLGRQWQAQWDDYSYYDDSEVYYETPQPVREYYEINDVEEVVPFDTNAWYVVYVKDLISKGIIDYVDNPAEQISQRKFREIIGRTSTYCYEQFGTELFMDYTIYESLYSDKTISKFDAVGYIVKIFFPQEKYPIDFAIQNGIVSPDFNVSEARRTGLIYVELIKMLTKTSILVRDLY